MNVTLGHYLTLGAVLFALSVIGIFLNRKNLIVLLMAIDNGVRLGLLRAHDTTLAATVMYGSLRQVIDRYLLSTADEPDLHHLAHEVVAVAMRGLHAPTEPAP